MSPNTKLTTGSACSLMLALAGCASTPDPLMFDAGYDNQAGLTFSPDGQTAYWFAWDGDWGSSTAGQKTIFMATRRSQDWTKPLAMPFTGDHSDEDPFVSPDGRWLYFVSERSRNEGGEKSKGDIWRYGLVEPHTLERLAINSVATEFSPVVTDPGTLYFASSRKGGPGQGDIYRADAEENGFGEPVVLGPAVNSPTGEWNVWVSPDETRMIFEASERSTNVSVAGDLYYSTRTASGWSAAIPLKSLNGNGSDLLPRLHPDGQTLFYTTAPIGGNAAIIATKFLTED